jgi:hypothetical protein
MSWSSGVVNRRWVLTVAAAALVAGTGLASGCSKSEPGPVKGQAMVPAPKFQEALRAAKEAVAGKKSVRIKGLIVADGSAMTIDFGVVGGSGGGSVELDGGKADARVINGSLYLNGDNVFWDALKKGSSNDFADSWVQVSHTSGAQFAALLDLIPAGGMLDTLAPTNSSWTDVEGRTLNGVETVGLRDVQSGHGNTVYVGKAKPGIPVGIELAKGGLLEFTGWGSAVKAPVMPPQPVLDAMDMKLKG